VRVAGEGPNVTTGGYIAVFDQLSEDLGGHRERIARGAFSDSLRRDDIRALWNHDADLVLGRNKAGTLDLAEDAFGLAFKNTPPQTSWFSDRLVTLRRGDVTGCSFGFYTDADSWLTEADGTRVRTIEKVTLIEVSPGVTFPAYPQPNVEAAQRSMQRWFRDRAKAELQRIRAGGGAVHWSVEARWRRLRLHELSL
jgi:HK97 family phage prohead protease